MKKGNRIASILFAGLIGLGCSVAIQSCSSDPNDPGLEYMPDMYRSPSFETNSGNPNFTDSLTNRVPVKGSIPRGINYTPYAYANTPEGYEAAGAGLKNPLEKSEANIAEGKRIFDIYCVHCHGDQGKGDGSIVANGKFPPPPSYSNQLKDLPEGKIFHSIHYGKNMMGSHASQISQSDRWKVVMYVQALQKLGNESAPAAAEAAPVAKN